MKVMILAYDFPPYVSVGGLRPYSWFRYLGEFGVEPVVITRQWANHYRDERDYVAPSASAEVEIERSDRGTIVRTPYAPTLSDRMLLAEGSQRHRLVRKLITAWYEISQYYASVGPKVRLFHAARNYLSNQKVDAIVATGEPFVLFKYAARLSEEFAVPWVADYRDPWSQDKRRVWTRRWETGLERRITASASVITTPSAVFVHLLARLHAGKTIVVISNGYDPEAMVAAQSTEQDSERLTIAFTGSLYPWYPVESVFRAFEDFIQSSPKPDFTLHMIGVGSQEALSDALRSTFPGLASRVTFTGRLPNDQMARELAKANAFLMFNNYAQSGTKVFDYLALKRRIILCYSDDPEAKRLKHKHYNMDLAPGTNEHVLETMVEDSKSGVVVKDFRHLGEVLTGLHNEFKAKGRIACEPVGTEKYSRRAQAKEMASVLKGLIR